MLYIKYSSSVNYTSQHLNVIHQNASYSEKQMRVIISSCFHLSQQSSFNWFQRKQSWLIAVLDRSVVKSAWIKWLSSTVGRFGWRWPPPFSWLIPCCSGPLKAGRNGIRCCLSNTLILISLSLLPQHVHLLLASSHPHVRLDLGKKSIFCSAFCFNFNTEVVFHLSVKSQVESSLLTPNLSLILNQWSRSTYGHYVHNQNQNGVTVHSTQKRICDCSFIGFIETDFRSLGRWIMQFVCFHFCLCPLTTWLYFGFTCFSLPQDFSLSPSAPPVQFSILHLMCL